MYSLEVYREPGRRVEVYVPVEAAAATVSCSAPETRRSSATRGTDARQPAAWCTSGVRLNTTQILLRLF